MDEYPHPLFFEAKELTDREKEKIRRHFQKKRDSGGGDCGTIENVEGNIYRISFREKEDQERVLQRKFHTISLPGGELHLTVSRTNSTQTPDMSQTQTFTKENTKCLEKIFKMEVYLMYYLRDNPKAYKILEKQLSAICCTLALNFDDEEAVVRGDIEKGPGGAFGAAEKWEIQVDRVFIGLTEGYSCYHVFEPKEIKMLEQGFSSENDNIKVYKEIGYSVIVGETAAVKERIEILKRKLPTRRELPVVEKKFKLVEEIFSQGMSVHYPEVKIHRANNMIIMEGPDKQVQSGAIKLDELMKKILEKRINLPKDLITFITISSAISKYQARFQHSLRSPVSLEVESESDLVLSSLSSAALDEAEAAVMRDLTDETVKLQDTAAVPLYLNRVKEILIKAKNDANCGEFRVEVIFISGASGTTVDRVRLVGYSENVNKLKEVLHDYHMNQVGTQEVLDLLCPEMVNDFDQILSLIGFKQTKVTLQPRHFPTPCVLISGPRCHVLEAKQALVSAVDSLTSDTLVLDGPGAQQFFQEGGKVSKNLLESSCQVLIREQKTVFSPDVETKTQSISNASHSVTHRPSVVRRDSHTVGSFAVNKASLEIKLGSLEDEQVNVLVVPMLNKQLTSTKIGKGLLKKAGNRIQLNFNSVAANCTLSPGDVLQVDGHPSLGCSKIFFIECMPWDGARGQSVQALNKGLKSCLDLCVQQGMSSVAFPVIGPGIIFKYPLTEAIEILTGNIHQFGLSASCGSLTTIRVVIKPGYPDSEECYHDVHRHLSLNMSQGGQVIFKSLTSDLDDITMTAGGGVKLQVVFGDITNETTDAIVNTTDFVHFEDDGVCKDILTVAGPEVKAKLKAAKVNQGEVFVTQSGSFPCKAILHVCGEKDARTIEQLVCRIIQLCESSGYKSVAIPAICTGVGGMDHSVVADAILKGVKTATSSTPLRCLTDIHLILFTISAFLEFKAKAMKVFSISVINRVPVPQRPHVQQQEPLQSVNTDLSILYTSSANRQSVFMVLGLCRDDVSEAMTKLKALYQAQCSTQTFTKEQLECLTQDNIKDLKKLVETKGLLVQRDQSDQGSLIVSGLKDGVNQVMQMMTACLHGSLRREVREREEDDLYSRVAWCILGPNGNWERLPKTANYNLETKNVAGGIVDAQTIEWSVDLGRMEATRRGTGQKTMLKQLVNRPDFTLPLHWDNMAPGETMKVVALQPSSAEYRTIKQAFKQTVSKTVVKIERLQNVHLHQAYEAQKKHISDKNVQEGGAGEKLLYHGTTQDNCDSIMKTGFNRSFAGQNATAYGQGTYFAVNASYSAKPTYSKPAADGSQLMFVARVLTGAYTVGNSTMKVPPLRNSQQQHDRYDSLVDKIDNPKMYVVFHDNQAYPDYLITFK
ncbi:protein mono-ADP-ribosyltransferase PARP14-like [Toxotes jaculatrix]|uniref:protein mono-ADP-ribosyltransferase PARP14-like n=1 Tax=Toxotes jaculatrix TaxID=941984 RepID=UPI001B3A93F2|nr:protein mono-ADP-ribosyltransferase PARP14-like [Toxotes jaculatrix]